MRSGGCFMFLNIDCKPIHYEKSGSGQPIILLHGNGENLSIFKECTNLLKHFFTVYAVDMPGHGKSYHPDELHYETQAKAIYSFIQALNIEKPVLYGFSDGGIVGLLLASEYPNLLSKLIVSGVNIHPYGLKAINRLNTKIRYLATKSKKALMMLAEPNITRKDLGKIKVPTFLTVGEYDCVRPAHTKLICKHIKNCHLKVFKQHLHGSYVVHSQQIAKYILATQE